MQGDSGFNEWESSNLLSMWAALLGECQCAKWQCREIVSTRVAMQGDSEYAD